MLNAGLTGTKEAPKEEKKRVDWKTIAIVILAGLLVFCIVKIATADDRIEELDTRLSQRVIELSRIRGELDSIYAYVDEQIRSEASLLSDMDYSFGTLNAEHHTVEVHLAVVPKVLSDNMTVSVSTEGATAELTQNGSTFEGTLEVGLFLDHVQSPLLTIQTASGTQTEVLENIQISKLYTRFLPVLNGYMAVRGTCPDGNLHADFDLTVTNTSAFVSYILVKEIDGTEISRKDMTTAVKSADGIYSETYNKEISITRGQTLRIYMIAEDTLGYIHKQCVWIWEYDENGTDSIMTITDDSVYDGNGNLLYGR